MSPLAPFPVDLSEHDDPTRDTIAAATIDVWLSEVLSQWWQLPEPVKLRLSHLLEMEAPPQVWTFTAGPPVPTDALPACCAALTLHRPS